MFILSILTNYADGVIDQAQHNPGFYLGILVFLFEVFVRLRPTAKNLSILDKLHTLIGIVLPNYKTEKSRDDAGKLIKDKFKIK